MKGSQRIRFDTRQSCEDFIQTENALPGPSSKDLNISYESLSKQVVDANLSHLSKNAESQKGYDLIKHYMSKLSTNSISRINEVAYEDDAKLDNLNFEEKRIVEQIQIMTENLKETQKKYSSSIQNIKSVDKLEQNMMSDNGNKL